MLIASHSMNFISKLSDRILLLHRGKVVMIGKPDEVLEKYSEMRKRKKAQKFE